jgi:hypothetical protein
MSLFLFMMAIVFFSFSNSAYSWPLYSKPEFRGRVIDAETKQPSEGAVVVVLYEKWEFSGPGGGNTLPMDAKETLTDKDGDFYFPSYKTLIGPLSRVSDVSFIIFKPGYMSINRIEGIKIPDEKYFAIEKDMVGKEGEIKYVNARFVEPVTKTWKGFMGIVELKKVSPDKAMPPGGIPANYGARQLPLLYKAINTDRKNRGLKGEVE